MYIELKSKVIAESERRLLETAQRLLDEIERMPDGYKSGELVLAAREMQEAVSNFMLPAIKARSPRVISALTNYIQFTTEGVRDATANLESFLAS